MNYTVFHYSKYVALVRSFYDVKIDHVRQVLNCYNESGKEVFGAVIGGGVVFILEGDRNPFGVKEWNERRGEILKDAETAKYFENKLMKFVIDEGVELVYCQKKNLSEMGMCEDEEDEDYDDDELIDDLWDD